MGMAILQMDAWTMRMLSLLAPVARAHTRSLLLTPMPRCQAPSARLEALLPMPMVVQLMPATQATQHLGPSAWQRATSLTRTAMETFIAFWCALVNWVRKVHLVVLAVTSHMRTAL